MYKCQTNNLKNQLWVHIWRSLSMFYFLGLISSKNSSLTLGGHPHPGGTRHGTALQRITMQLKCIVLNFKLLIHTCHGAALQLITMQCTIITNCKSLTSTAMYSVHCILGDMAAWFTLVMALSSDMHCTRWNEQDTLHYMKCKIQSIAMN